MIDLSGCVSLVTGASRGIGRACALRLAKAGSAVVVNYLTSATAAEEVAREINNAGCDAAVIKADVSEHADVEQMMAFVEQRFGRLDVLVSNAASGGFRPLMSATDAHFAATMNTNVKPLLSLVRCASHMLKVSPMRGRVIAMSSRGAHLAMANYGLIGASKAALESLVRQFALELGPDGINFNIVEAGMVVTNSTKQIPDFLTFEQAVRARALIEDRPLNAGDIADTVLYLCSPLSRMVQGQTIVVDAGSAVHV